MSNKNSILFTDPAFDPASSAGCDLLVRLGMDSLSYAIIDKDRHKIMAVYDEQECDEPINRLADRAKTDPYLTLSYQKTKLAVYAENVIHIPEALFEHAEFQLSTAYFPDIPTDALTQNADPEWSFRSVFGLSPAAADKLESLWPGHQRFALSTPLFKALLLAHETALFLDFTAGAVYMALFNNRQLLFQQGYEVANADELAYYLFLIREQLQIDSHATPVYISGIIHPGDAKYNRIVSCFKEVNPLLPVNAGLNTDVLEDMPAHYYTTLLALDQCG